MIVLPDDIRKTVREWRDKVYSRMLLFVAEKDDLGEDVSFTNTATTSETVEVEALIKDQFIGKREDYILDAKCGLLFTWKEREEGVDKLHDHETGKVY